jgi:3-hydroxyisobutyrate dehydrogenase
MAVAFAWGSLQIAGSFGRENLMSDDNSGSRPRLGFIGVGLMGGPMTSRLLDAGFQVTIWNRSAEKMAPLVAKGAVAADSPKGVAEASDIIMMCLTAAPAVREVVFGENGVAAAGSADKVLVDFSSMRPDSTAEWATELRDKTGMGWVDSPVSGGVPGAEQGTLAIMAGGIQEDFDKVAPVVAHVSQRYTLMGPNGAGQSTKLANQIVAGCLFVVVCECINFARASGVDASKIPEALKGGFADSIPMQLFGPRFAADQYEPKMGAIETIVKDLDTIFDMARIAGQPVPMATRALDLFRLLSSKGYDNADLTSINKLYNDLGIEG